MDAVGLRELRQDASDLVRRVEAGEEIEVTVSGRPAARLVPVSRRRWLAHREVADLFEGSEDPTWAVDRDLVDHDVDDPWSTRS